MTARDYDYISCADTAKLARAALKDAFPAIKFSVRSRTYSMGASIDVQWTDGPTEKEVKAIVGQFEGSTFDGMQDLKSYHTSIHPVTKKAVHYAADSVHCNRQYSKAFYEPIARRIARNWGLPDPEIVEATDYSSAHPKDDPFVKNADTYLSTLIWREIQNISALPPRTAEKRVKGVLTFDRTTENGHTVWYIGGDTWPNQRTIKEHTAAKWDKVRKAYRVVADELPPAVLALGRPREEIKQIDADQRAARFTELADGMQPAIDEKRRPRDWNPTARRNRMDEARANEARTLEMVQDKLYALAAAWREGSVPDILQGITNRAQVEYILTHKVMPPADSNWEETQRDYKRMTAAGLRDDTEFFAAREALQNMGNQHADKKTAADELRDLERDVALKPIPGYFPTPDPLVEEMIQRADIRPYQIVLEPSAGAGHIADAVRAAHTDNPLTIIEVNATLVSLLRQKGFAPIVDDFLSVHTSADRILMNPPFENMQDVEHVRHAYNLLRPGGRLVAIMSESPFFRQDKKAKDFREWLDSVGGESTRNAPDAFKASDRPTGVQTRLVVIDKPVTHTTTRPTRATIERLIEWIKE